VLRLGREMPGSVATGGVARYFRIKENHPYHKQLIVETHLPSVNIGKQTIHDPENPDDPEKCLYVINALTPINDRETHVFHVQCTSYEPNWTPAEADAIRYIVNQDKIALEEIQRRFDEHSLKPIEISVKADTQGIVSRRKIIEMVKQERAA
jgi:hypothetical protein